MPTVTVRDSHHVYDDATFDVDPNTTDDEVKRLGIAQMYGCPLEEVDESHVEDMLNDVTIYRHVDLPKWLQDRIDRARAVDPKKLLEEERARGESRPYPGAFGALSALNRHTTETLERLHREYQMKAIRLELLEGTLQSLADKDLISEGLLEMIYAEADPAEYNHRV